MLMKRDKLDMHVRMRPQLRLMLKSNPLSLRAKLKQSQLLLELASQLIFNLSVFGIFQSAVYPVLQHKKSPLYSQKLGWLKWL